MRSPTLLLVTSILRPACAFGTSRLSPQLRATAFRGVRSAASQQQQQQPRMAADAGAADAAVPAIYFVMGGPGSGKGTQCAKLVSRYGMVHLSAGDLLRAEVSSGSELGKGIKAVIDQGKIVTSETTVALLCAAMAGGPGPFLIDGFPRSISNLEAFEQTVRPANFMLFLEVSEAEMEARLLNRGKSSGRSDDNRETIVKRFRTFESDSMPVVAEFANRDCLRRVDADATEDEVFGRVCAAFADQGLGQPA